MRAMALVRGADPTGNLSETAVNKLSDFVLYSDPQYYSAFPSIVRQPDGELLVAFRRAPERRPYGGRCTHADPNSQLVLVRSKDDGRSWSDRPSVIHAHPMGGSQDPCLVQWPDGEILCASYLWIILSAESPTRRINDPNDWKFAFAGGYLMRSKDGGRHWQGPIIPPPAPGAVEKDHFGRPLPAYNRGPLLVGSDGLLYWAVVGSVTNTSVHLMVSADRGSSWEYRCPIAVDEKITFNETALYETVGGDIIAFIRTADFDDHTVIARSKDRGRTFQPWQDAGFQGHPHHAGRLPDGRVFLVYGYRHKPYGVRTRVLDAECTDIAGAGEIVLRDDGHDADLGYPWSLVMPDGRVLVVYYFNIDDGPRHIAGTWLGP